MGDTYWACSSQILKNLFLLRKARPFINENVAKMLYFTIIQSHLEYCSPVWSNATNSVLNKMRVLQKRALRIVLKCDNNIRSNEYFRGWKLTQLIYDGRRLLYYCLKPCMYKICQYICHLEFKWNAIHTCYVTSVSQIYLPKPKTDFFKAEFYLCKFKDF